jgi:hypothetical protein
LESASSTAHCVSIAAAAAAVRASLQLVKHGWPAAGCTSSVLHIMQQSGWSLGPEDRIVVSHEICMTWMLAATCTFATSRLNLGLVQRRDAFAPIPLPHDAAPPLGNMATPSRQDCLCAALALKVSETVFAEDDTA